MRNPNPRNSNYRIIRSNWPKSMHYSPHDPSFRVNRISFQVPLDSDYAEFIVLQVRLDTIVHTASISHRILYGCNNSMNSWQAPVIYQVGMITHCVWSVHAMATVELISINQWNTDVYQLMQGRHYWHSPTDLIKRWLSAKWQSMGRWHRRVALK